MDTTTSKSMVLGLSGVLCFGPIGACLHDSRHCIDHKPHIPIEMNLSASPHPGFVMMAIGSFSNLSAATWERIMASGTVLGD